MNLVIRAQTLNDQPISQTIVGCFDEKGGTIGRSDTNTMTLPDPERHISRLQAEVNAQAGGFAIRNAGAATAIFINGRAVAPGEASRLSHGDELRIGGYALGVLLEAENGSSSTIVQGRAAVDARAVIVGSAAEVRTDPRAMADRKAGAGPVTRAPTPQPASGNPFADLLGPAPAAAAEADDPFAFLGSGQPLSPGPALPANAPARPASPIAASAFPGPRPPTAAPKPVPLPADFDPFASLDEMVAPAKAKPASSNAADSILDSIGSSSSTAPSLDESFGLGPSEAGAADPLAAFMNAPSPARQHGSLLETAPDNDPFAMFGTGAKRESTPGPAAFDHTPELRGAYRPPAVLPPPAPAPAPPPATPADPFAGLGLTPASADDPLAGFLAGTAPAPAPAPQPPSAPASQPPAVAHVAAPVAAPRPKPAAVRVPAPPPAAASFSAASASAASASSPAHASDELWAAFCEGAGVSLPAQPLDTDQMRMLGMIMREAVDGVVRLMALRAVAKSELRATVTTIRATNNNPMKFSPDFEVALRQMLQPPVRGFMPGPAAMQDAMHDLVGHTIGTMAGMRAALAGVLERFEPAQLEGKLATGSMLDNLLPGGRKAKLWDLYLKHFGAIRNDAQDDFHTLFGKAFVAAYEAQLDQLQAPRG